MGDEGGGGEKKNDDCVKVAIRCRPLSSKETGNGEASIVQMQESTGGEEAGSITLTDPEGKEKPVQFAFDIVFDTATEQVLVYETVGKPAIESTLNGYNGTIFAYGQTGSGKSWCMTGGAGDLRGIIPRVNEKLFDRIQHEKESISTRQFLVMCSFFEIYNEIIFDLLNPVQDRSKLGAGLQVKEHPVLGIYVKDLQEIVVTDAEKLGNLMASGTKNRAVSSTMMNATSSRSHSIFTIKVHQKDDEDKSKNVFAKLNLVDLAGSERQKGTGASGQTLKEGANINKSLSALGNVINALVENANGKKVFVPYRNSKLTRVLQESLGGNSLCTMLATLSPAACNFEETLSTLRYANRAKAIKVSATKNEEASQISRLNVEIEELKKKLAAGGTGGDAGGGLMAEEERREIKGKYAAQLQEMEMMISSTWEEKQKVSAKHEEELKKAQEKYKLQVKRIEEESRKRFRLLQEQNDIELTIRGLLDTLQCLPTKADGSFSHQKTTLCSGELPRQWLKMASAISEAADSVKQQHTMALMFQGAFSEDLKMWIEGAEAGDTTMARTGVRLASKKSETLRKECEKIVTLEREGQSQAQAFSASIVEARSQWSKIQETFLKEWRESEGDQEDKDKQAQDKADEKADEEEGKDGERELPTLISRALEDIGRILQLGEQQVQARCAGFASTAVMKMVTPAELVLRGAPLLTGATIEPTDDALLKSLVGDTAGQEAPAPKEEEARPKEERPLHEWSVADVDSSVEGTEKVLSTLIELQGLNKKRTPVELLSRPPPKFVHDVAVLVRQVTGFLGAMAENWPDDRQEKIDLLQYISDNVAAALGIDSVDFDPADVLKGKEVEKTLRLLQLLAVAAASEKHGQADGAGGSGGGNKSAAGKGEGLTPAAEMPRVLDTIGRYLAQGAQRYDAERDLEQKNGRASPTKELENSLQDLKERLQEESRVREKVGQRLAEFQKQLKGSQQILGEKKDQLEDARQLAGEKDGQKQELRNKLEQLRAGLLQRAQQMTGNAEVSGLSKELQEVAELQNKASQAKEALAAEVKKLVQQRAEADMERETFELEVKRMKLRMAEGLDGSKNIHQTEELLSLQAEKQKLDVRLATLEEKLRTAAEADDFERQKENRIIEEAKLQTAKNDDKQDELQVIIEERDALREGMDQLWQEKARNEEDLDNLSQGYTNLSDRLVEKADEFRELEEKLQEYENLESMLKANYEKNRQSPVMVPPEPPPECAPPPATATQATPPLAPSDAAAAPAAPQPDTGNGGGDDAGSSHYSDDDFEEYADDFSPE